MRSLAKDTRSGVKRLKSKKIGRLPSAARRWPRARLAETGLPQQILVTLWFEAQNTVAGGPRVQSKHVVYLAKQQLAHSGSSNDHGCGGVGCELRRARCSVCVFAPSDSASGFVRENHPSN